MMKWHLPSFIGVSLATAAFIMLTASTSVPLRVDSRQDWPEAVRSGMQTGGTYRKYSVENLEIHFSDDRPLHPIAVIFRKDNPSPWVYFDDKGVKIHDSSGAIISADSVESDGKIDRFAYASHKGSEFIYYSDHNMDGRLDVKTTHYPGADPFRPPLVKVYINDQWYTLTGERFFGDQWYPESDVRQAAKAGKKEIKHHARTLTETGPKIVKFECGIPGFVDQVQPEPQTEITNTSIPASSKE